MKKADKIDKRTLRESFANNLYAMKLISHRLSSVKNADKVFMLEQGRMIEEGTHKELMKMDGSYATMYKKQAMNYLAIDNVEGVEL